MKTEKCSTIAWRQPSCSNMVLSACGAESDKDFGLPSCAPKKEPLECHRTILVARHLAALGLDVQHIHADGTLESHADALGRLERMLNLAEDNLFLSREELSADAYHRQAERIAYELESVPAEAPTFRSAAG
jgi:hypothetical protein